MSNRGVPNWGLRIPAPFRVLFEPSLLNRLRPMQFSSPVVGPPKLESSCVLNSGYETRTRTRLELELCVVSYDGGRTANSNCADARRLACVSKLER